MERGLIVSCIETRFNGRHGDGFSVGLAQPAQLDGKKEGQGVGT